MGVAPARIHTGFNAVDVKYFHEAAEQHRRVHRTEASGHRFIYIGQLIPRKRVDRIIEAFHAIATEHDSLTIVGAGDERPNIIRLVGTFQLESQVQLIPNVLNADVPDILSDHHTLVLASDEEVWGLVANEALACGLHVAVSKNCGVAASIQNMRGVHTAETNSLRDLSTAMTASRDSWSGPINNPEILQHTPERFADVFYDALSEGTNQ
jgi:glycosyltransferase involved in cell wall biosynthesis